VPTAAKPYGVAFDRAGKRIFVSAALAGKLQCVFGGFSATPSRSAHRQEVLAFHIYARRFQDFIGLRTIEQYSCDRRRFVQTGRYNRTIQAALGHRDLPEVIWQLGIALDTAMSREPRSGYRIDSCFGRASGFLSVRLADLECAEQPCQVLELT
jgi:hypothetical protein